MNIKDKKTSCMKTYQKEWREANKDVVIGHRVRHRYGITIDEYKDAMSSSHCCEICGAEENLCYDHDHTTGAFRGVLCRTCNTAIGTLGDTIQGLNMAILYLKRHYNKT